MKVHTHDFIEIAYVCDGKGYHLYNGITYPVSKGELYIINSQTSHSFYPTDRDIMLYKSLYAEEIIYTPALRLQGVMRTEIEQIYDKLYLEFTTAGINYIQILKLSLCELLLKIHRFYKMKTTPASTPENRYLHQLIPDCRILKESLFPENYHQRTFRYLLIVVGNTTIILQKRSPKLIL